MERRTFLKQSAASFSGIIGMGSLMSGSAAAQEGLHTFRDHDDVIDRFEVDYEGRTIGLFSFTTGYRYRLTLHMSRPNARVQATAYDSSGNYEDSNTGRAVNELYLTLDTSDRLHTVEVRRTG